MENRRQLTLRTCHLVSAMLLGIFVSVHLINHIVALFGQSQHVLFMHAVRPLYRNAVIEPALLLAFAWQVVSGIIMVIRGWRTRRGGIAWLQAGSGIYLAAFVSVHAFAVLTGRTMLGLDTDFRFAAAGFHVQGWPWFFWPYYTLAVFSLLTHIGCALYWNILGRHPQSAKLALRMMIVSGGVLGLLISSALAGRFYSVDIPVNYLATYAEH
jgi:hypothetical protein